MAQAMNQIEEFLGGFLIHLVVQLLYFSDPSQLVLQQTSVRVERVFLSDQGQMCCF